MCGNCALSSYSGIVIIDELPQALEIDFVQTIGFDLLIIFKKERGTDTSLRFSIITSYVEYGHYITGLQVLSLCLVFGALFFKSLLDASAFLCRLSLSLRSSLSGFISAQHN